MVIKGQICRLKIFTCINSVLYGPSALQVRPRAVDNGRFRRISLKSRCLHLKQLECHVALTLTVKFNNRVAVEFCLIRVILPCPVSYIEIQRQFMEPLFATLRLYFRNGSEIFFSVWRNMPRSAHLRNKLNWEQSWARWGATKSWQHWPKQTRNKCMPA